MCAASGNITLLRSPKIIDWYWRLLGEESRLNHRESCNSSTLSQNYIQRRFLFWCWNTKHYRLSASIAIMHWLFNCVLFVIVIYWCLINARRFKRIKEQPEHSHFRWSRLCVCVSAEESLSLQHEAGLTTHTCIRNWGKQLDLLCDHVEL